MSNSSLVRSVPKYSKHKASGRAYARFDGRCIYFGRYGTASSREAFGRPPTWCAIQMRVQLRCSFIVGRQGNRLAAGL